MVSQEQLDKQKLRNGPLLQRFAAIKADRSTIEDKWSKIDRYIVPFDQGSFASRIESENAKDWSSLDVWDSTAPIGQERLVSMLYAGLISGRWLSIGFQNPKLQKDPKAGGWVSDTVDRMFETIMASNFPVEFGSLVSHWVNYGNGCMSKTVVYDHAGSYDGFDFNCRPPRAMFFEEDWQGRVHRSFTPLEWTATKIVSKWRDPKDSTKPHPSIPDFILQQATAPAGAAQKHRLMYVIEPREGAKPMALNEKARAADQRPFRSWYILEQTLTDLGDEGGEYNMPVYVTRYMKSASSQWGYGPSMLVLPAVGLLNGIQEQVVDAGAKVLNPATLVTEWGLMSDLKLGSGEYTTVRSLDDIKPYESGAHFDVSNDLLLRHANMIRKYYREDDIEASGSGQMSATEWNGRDERLNALFGIPVRRMYWEALGPAVRDTFNDMLREGQLDAIPDILLDPKVNPRMKVNFQGRFARAIRSDEVTSIERLLAAKAALTKMDPRSRARFAIKDDVALREMQERLSTPPEMMASEEDVTKAVEQEQKMQEMATQAEIAKTQAEGNRAQAGAQEMQRGMQGGGM
jgi:hypothetical protein